jgi:uncharacterized protein
VTGGRDRDRDAAGRPRSARPRDGLGRPLDRRAAGEPTMGEDPALPPDQSLALAQRLLDSGRPFHAHEVLEASWRAAPPGERDLWRGLAQLAVGLTHASRGKRRGAVALLRRGAAAVGGYAGQDCHGIDPAALAASAGTLADQIETGQIETGGPAGLAGGATGAAGAGLRLVTGSPW